jgi:hypothetical protein
MTFALQAKHTGSAMLHFALLRGRLGQQEDRKVHYGYVTIHSAWKEELGLTTKRQKKAESDWAYLTRNIHVFLSVTPFHLC